MDSLVAAEIAEAALAFAEVWARFLPDVPDDYACHFTCIEADAAADLFRACGEIAAAEALIAAHAAHDEPGEPI